MPLDDPEYTDVKLSRARREHLPGSALAREFHGFLLHGRILDLAVGVVIGAAAGAVVNALVSDLMTPLIGALGGQPDFSKLAFRINGSRFRVGHFINELIAFVMVGAIVFFLIIKPTTALTARIKKAEERPTRICPECLTEVPLQAKRCAACTVALPPLPVTTATMRTLP